MFYSVDHLHKFQDSAIWQTPLALKLGTSYFLKKLNSSGTFAGILGSLSINRRAKTAVDHIIKIVSVFATVFALLFILKLPSVLCTVQ